eukprot:m.199322 g.199322  ORF g.199322 m.199322 type:complete len:959 (-) comp17681_c1_seq2:2591-5467(-)
MAAAAAAAAGATIAAEAALLAQLDSGVEHYHSGHDACLCVRVLPLLVRVMQHGLRAGSDRAAQQCLLQIAGRTSSDAHLCSLRNSPTASWSFQAKEWASCVSTLWLSKCVCATMAEFLASSKAAQMYRDGALLRNPHFSRQLFTIFERIDALNLPALHAFMRSGAQGPGTPGSGDHSTSFSSEFLDLSSPMSSNSLNRVLSHSSTSSSSQLDTAGSLHSIAGGSTLVANDSASNFSGSRIVEDAPAADLGNSNNVDGENGDGDGDASGGGSEDEADATTPSATANRAPRAPRLHIDSDGSDDESGLDLVLPSALSSTRSVGGHTHGSSSGHGTIPSRERSTSAISQSSIGTSATMTARMVQATARKFVQYAVKPMGSMTSDELERDNSHLVVIDALLHAMEERLNADLKIPPSLDEDLPAPLPHKTWNPTWRHGFNSHHCLTRLLHSSHDRLHALTGVSTLAPSDGAGPMNDRPMSPHLSTRTQSKESLHGEVVYSLQHSQDVSDAGSLVVDDSDEQSTNGNGSFATRSDDNQSALSTSASSSALSGSTSTHSSRPAYVASGTDWVLLEGEELLDDQLGMNGYDGAPGGQDRSSSPQVILAGFMQSLGAVTEDILMPIQMVSPDDAQGAAARPMLTLDDLAGPDQPWNDHKTSEPKLRGNEEWAPPRNQIIFNVHKKPAVKSTALAAQGNLCCGCGTPVYKNLIKHFRWDEYLGRYFCSSCHGRNTHIIPGRVLWQWDFSPYQVSNHSYGVLTNTYMDPLYDVAMINSKLYTKHAELRKARKLRQQLALVRSYLRSCKYGADLLQAVENPSYMVADVDLYSLRDLVDIKTRQFTARLSRLLDAVLAHTRSCPLCQARGFICELCNSKNILFPFQTDDVAPCPECRNIQHKACLNNKKLSCRKCKRIENMQKAREKKEMEEKERLEKEEKEGKAKEEKEGVTDGVTEDSPPAEPQETPQ